MAAGAKCDAVVAKGSMKIEKARAALDDKVRRVHEMRHAINVSLWALGAALNDLHLTQAWLARGTHASWKQFVEVEIKMSVASANRLIGISHRFTEDQTRAYGVNRLCEIRTAPEKCWPALLALCESGATVKDLRDQVRAIKMAERKSPKTRVLVRRPGAVRDTSRASEAAAEKRATNRKDSSQPRKPAIAQEWSIVLMARKSPGEKAAKPARSIAQQPSGYVAVEGAGTVSFSLFEGEGGAICIDVKFAPDGRQS